LGAARWARFSAALAITISLGLPSWAQVSTQDSVQKPPAQNAAATLAQAQQALDQNDFQHAATLLAEYLAQHPENAVAHFQLGYAYSNLKREADAAKEYARAAELKPDFAEAHLNLGLALVDSDPAAAAASFKHAADLTPKQAKPRFLAGYALEHSGDYAGAAAQYEQASALDAKSFDVFFSWGRALLRSGDAAGAEQRFRQALALRADSAPAHLGLANSLVEQRKADAAAEFAEYLKLQPADRAARLQLASLLYGSGKTVDALAELDRVDAGGPPSGESARLRASIAISQEQWGAAVRVLSPAVAAAPSDAVLHAELGHVLLEKKDYANARPELQKAITLDPKQTDVLRDLMDAEYLGGDCPAALQSLDELAQREAPKAGVWFVRATCYDKQQRIAEAASAYHKFLDMDQGRNDKQDFQARERLKVLERQLDKKK
jgi:Flp pilus assembly protein TadD